MKTHCNKCKVVLESWEGVNCGTYDLCDNCYDKHIPEVANSENCVGEDDALLPDYEILESN